MIRFKRWGWLLLVILTGILLVYFATRNFLLHRMYEHVRTKWKNEKHVALSVSEIRFSGFAGIVIRHLSVIPEQQDTMLKVDSGYVCFSWLSLFSGHVNLKEAAINHAFFFIACNDSGCNYDFLTKKKSGEASASSERNYSVSANHLIRSLFNHTPQQADFKDIHISYLNDEKKEHLYIPSFSSSKEDMQGTLINPSDSSQWNLTGKFSQRHQTFDVKIYSEHFQQHPFPFLQSIFAASCRFDTLHCILESVHATAGLVKVAGRIHATELFIRHAKISDQTVVVHQADFSFRATVGMNSLELDSASSFLLNKILIRPYVKFLNDQNNDCILKIGIDKMVADDFFKSLPAGMFNEMDGVEADGNLAYHLDFSLNSSMPDSLVFNSVMTKENFRLKKPGSSNLLKMNSEFLYSAYDGDRFIRSFAVGNSNPDFVPLDRVSSYFKNAVMTSEDGSFFFHSGFNQDAFRKSIAANYKAGKFVRGGSTITMQLVKNVFLTRHKTIARKAEEALIVWLIESNHLSSKERMFEVYLNIIELGPDVYGVGEASRFYFNKKASDLNLAESVFLASLLPRPKWFKYSFDEAGNLKPYFADYYRVVANFLLKKNLITQAEYDQLQPHIELRGPAKYFVTPADSVPALEEEQGNEEN